MDIGIFGLPKSGKTTVFNALTRSHAATAAYAAEDERHVAVVKVPDPRLGQLADLFHPQRVVPAEVRYTDFAAPAKGFSRSEGFPPQLLADLRLMDVLLVVVRAFEDSGVPHVASRVDPLQDAISLDLEMILADLGILQRRQERITASLRGARGVERDQLLHEQVALTQLQRHLENEQPLRGQELPPEMQPLLANFQFLTAKPLLVVANAGEAQARDLAAMEASLATRYPPPRAGVIALCGALEMELAQLTEAEASDLRAAYGLPAESALDRVIRASSEVAGLMHFFTVGPDEVRAWTVPVHSTALRAARAIHSDLERGFIRAEVIAWDTLLDCGGWAPARHRGLIRTEGRDYEVRDGEIAHILFNVGR